MRAPWSDRQHCSHNVSQKFTRIRHFSDLSPRPFQTVWMRLRSLLLLRWFNGWLCDPSPQSFETLTLTKSHACMRNTCQWVCFWCWKTGGLLENKQAGTGWGVSIGTPEMRGAFQSRVKTKVLNPNYKGPKLTMRENGCLFYLTQPPPPRPDRGK